MHCNTCQPGGPEAAKLDDAQRVSPRIATPTTPTPIDDVPLLDTPAAMASKLNPFLVRTAIRSASRAARPLAPQTRALSLTATRPSDSLMVVSADYPAIGYPLAVAIEALDCLTSRQHRNTPDNNPSIPFKFTEQNEAIIAEVLKRYPPQYKKAAVMPLLDLGQRQHGFTSISVMNEVARLLDMPPMRVYEVASFYTMYNRTPVGRFHVQACTTVRSLLLAPA